ASNSYSGTTTVNGGMLVLGCAALDAAYGGPLVINGAKVKLALSAETPNDQPITINGGGLFDMNSFAESISGNLTLRDGSFVSAGTATLSIAAPSTIVVTNSGGIGGTGNLLLNAGPCEMRVLSGSFDVHPNISGNADIDKTGGGQLALFGTNAYSGVTTI